MRSMRGPWRTDIQCSLKEDVLVLVAARARECDEQRRVGQRCAPSHVCDLPLWAILPDPSNIQGSCAHRFKLKVRDDLIRD
eukprot:scaffold94584_cov57-Phaeocystis_antarctica.AAC.5